MSKSIKLKNDIFLDYKSVYKKFTAYRGTAGLNMDNMTESGYYLFNEVSDVYDAPETYIDGMLEVENIKGTYTFIIQKLFNRSSMKYWVRMYWFGVFWTQWKEL